MQNMSSPSNTNKVTKKTITNDEIEFFITEPKLFIEDKDAMYELLTNYVQTENVDNAHFLMAHICMACIHAHNYLANPSDDEDNKFKQILCVIDAEIGADVRHSYMLRYLAMMVVAKAINNQALYQKVKLIISNLWAEWLLTFEAEHRFHNQQFAYDKHYILEVAFACGVNEGLIRETLKYCCNHASDDNYSVYVISYLWPYLTNDDKSQYLFDRCKGKTNIKTSHADSNRYSVAKLAELLLQSYFNELSRSKSRPVINLNLITMLCAEATGPIRELCFSKLFGLYESVDIEDHMGGSVEIYLALIFKKLAIEHQRKWQEKFIKKARNNDLAIEFLSHIINHFGLGTRMFFFEKTMSMLTSSSKTRYNNTQIWSSLNRFAEGENVTLFQAYLDRLLVCFDKVPLFNNYSNILLIAKIIKDMGVEDLREYPFQDDFRGIVQWATYYLISLLSGLDDNEAWPLMKEDILTLFARLESYFITYYMEQLNSHIVSKETSNKICLPKIFAFLKHCKGRLSANALTQIEGKIDKALESKCLEEIQIALDLIKSCCDVLSNQKYLPKVIALLKDDKLHMIALQAYIALAPINDVLKQQSMLDKSSYDLLATDIKFAMLLKIKTQKLGNINSNLLEILYDNCIDLLRPNTLTAQGFAAQKGQLTDDDIDLVSLTIDILIKFNKILPAKNYFNIATALTRWISDQPILSEALYALLMNFKDKSRLHKSLKFIYLQAVILAQTRILDLDTITTLKELQQILSEVYQSLKPEQLALDHILWIDTARQRLLVNVGDKQEVAFPEVNMDGQMLKQLNKEIKQSGMSVAERIKLMTQIIFDPRLTLLAETQIDCMLKRHFETQPQYLKVTLTPDQFNNKFSFKYYLLYNLCLNIICQHVLARFKLPKIKISETEYIRSLIKDSSLALIRQSAQNRLVVATIINRGDYLEETSQQIQPLVNQLKKIKSKLPFPFLLYLVLDDTNEGEVVDALRQRVVCAFDCIPHIVEVWPRLIEKSKQLLAEACVAGLYKVGIGDKGKLSEHKLKLPSIYINGFRDILKYIPHNKRKHAFESLNKVFGKLIQQQNLLSICYLINLLRIECF